MLRWSVVDVVVAAVVSLGHGLTERYYSTITVCPALRF